MIENLNMFNAKTFERIFPGKRKICVIGNGPIDKTDYKIIEDSDIVVRFNDWNRRRTFNKDTGNRCDVCFTMYDSAPIIKDPYTKPPCVIIAIPHPFHSERIIKVTNDMWTDVDVSMVNPYINEECCAAIGLNSPGNRHPISTVGFTFLYHTSRFLSDDYSVHVCGFSCRFDGDQKKFDQTFATNRKHKRHQNHCYVNEFWWIHDNLMEDSRFTFSRTLRRIKNLVKNVDKCSEDFNDLDKLMMRVIKGKPFALTRYGDYEIRAITKPDTKVGPNSKSWILDPNNEADCKLRQELIESYKYNDPNNDYIVGWHPKFPIPDDACNHIINACIMVNANYNQFLNKLIFSEFKTRKTVLICNEECDPSKLPFKPEKVFFIDKRQSCWRYGDIQDELEEYLTKTTESHVVLFAAGPYSCTVIWKAWSKGIKNHFLLDIGSVLDPYLFGKNTRGYHRKMSPVLSSVEDYNEVHNQTEGIPKKIHFVWIGKQMPEFCTYVLDMFKILNPDYDIKVHDESSLNDKYKPLLPKCRRTAQIADLIRASILEKEGGWYFDFDMIPNSSIDTIASEYKVKDFFIVAQRDKRITNSIIGSVKNHPIWKSYYNYVVKVEEWNYTMYGPMCFTEIVPEDMVCNDANMFYALCAKMSTHRMFYSMNDKEEFKKHYSVIHNRCKGRTPHMIHLWGIPIRPGVKEIFEKIYKDRGWTFEDQRRPEDNKLKIILSFRAEFGMKLMWHVPWVNGIKGTNRIICIEKGDECLYPNAKEYIVLDRKADKHRKHLSKFDKEFNDELKASLVKKYPDAEYIYPKEGGPLKCFVPTPTKLNGIGCDIVIAPRKRDVAPIRNWQHWDDLVSKLKDMHYKIFAVGSPDASYKVDCPASWDYDNFLDATVEALLNSKCLICTDTGVGYLSLLCGTMVNMISSNKALIHPGGTPIRINRFQQVNHKNVQINVMHDTWNSAESVMQKFLF